MAGIVASKTGPCATAKVVLPAFGEEEANLKSWHFGAVPREITRPQVGVRLASLATQAQSAHLGAMQLRLFAALSIPDEIADRLLLLRRDIRGARWRDREAYHLTLAFFGEVSHERAAELDNELTLISARPLTLRLEGVGWFGRREPSALWAGVANDAALNRLASDCELAGRRVGIEIPKRAYLPHVTLAYCSGTSLEAAGMFQAALGDFRTESFEVEQFELYSSNRTRGQNRYDEEATYPLMLS